MTLAPAETSATLSREEIVEEMERTAAEAGTSAQEVLRAYSAGELQEPGELAHVLVLADLLEDDDPLKTAE